MAFYELKPLSDREKRTLLPAPTGPSPELEPIAPEELPTLLPETYASKAVDLVESVPSPFKNPVKIKPSDAARPFTFPAEKISQLEESGPRLKERAQENIGDFVASPPPEEYSEEARTFLQGAKAAVGGTAATALEMVPTTPTEGLEYYLFGAATKGLSQSVRTGSAVNKFIGNYFPKTAEILFKERAAIPAALQGELNGVIYRIKKAFGVPQETGMVSWAQEALRRGEINEAQAAKMDRAIYDAILARNSKMAPGEVYARGTQSTPEPPPSAITPADLPSQELVNSVKSIQGEQAPFSIPGLGLQLGTERMTLAAKKLGETFGLTSSNIMSAMESANQAIQGGMDEVGANSAFWSRLPVRQILTQLGAPAEMMDAMVQQLKSGDPIISKQFMDQIISDNPVMSEIFPAEDKVDQAIKDMVANSQQEMIEPPPAAIPLPEAPPKTPEKSTGKNSPGGDRTAYDVIPGDEPVSELFNLPETSHPVKYKQLGASPQDVENALKEQYISHDLKLWKKEFLDKVTRKEDNRPLNQTPLVFLDFDGLKGLNTKLGYKKANRLFSEFARLANEHGFTMARYAGDEFAIVVNPIKRGGENPFEMLKRLGKFQDDLGNIEVVNDETGKVIHKGLSVTGTFGIAEDPDMVGDLNLANKDNMGRGQIYLDKKFIEDYNRSEGTNYEYPTTETQPLRSRASETLSRPGSESTLVDSTRGSSAVSPQPERAQSQTALNQTPNLTPLTGEEVSRLVPKRARKPKKYKPETFTQFVHSKGIDPIKSPDIKELEMRHLHRRGGHSLDGIRELAVEAGFLPQDSTENTVIEYLQDEKLGRKHYSMQDADVYANIEQPLETYSFGMLEDEIASLEAKPKLTAEEKRQLKSLKDEQIRRAEIPEEDTDFRFGDNFMEPGAQYGDQTQTKAFKEWFGDSKVVDAGGNPLVVYHGTNKSFTKFELQKTGGTGFYFTTDPDEAAFYADIRGRWQDDRGDNIIPAYVSIKNPASLEEFNLAYEKSSGGNPRKQAHEALAKKGYDGVVFRKMEDDGKVDFVIAFSPTQIKSATGNRGTFDPKNPNILKEPPPEFGKSPDSKIAGYQGDMFTGKQEPVTKAEMAGKKSEQMPLFQKAKPEFEVPGNKEKLKGFLDKVLNRMEMEAKGQEILDILQDRGETPATVTEKFWNETYDLLPDAYKAKVHKYIQLLSGFEPGAVVATHREKGNIVGKDWKDIGQNWMDMGNNIDYLEGTERGYIVTLASANEVLRKAKSDFDNSTKIGMEQSPELQAAIEKAEEIQGDLFSEAELAIPMTEVPPTPALVAQSNVDTKLVESGNLDFTSLTYEGPETAVGGLYHLKSETNENVYFLLLKGKKIIGVDHNSIGTPNHANVNIERVLKIAKKAGADEIIPVHNHPSGKVVASEDDLTMTVTLRKTAKQLGIQVGEHVIIDHGEYGVIDRDNVPSVHKFVEPKERSLKVKILKMSQERALSGNYQGRTVGNSMQAADVMKELIDKNKNTVFAMIMNNQMEINAVTAIATGKDFTAKIADTIADAVINHAGVNVVLMANEELSPGLLSWISKKLRPLQANLKDMIFPDATYSDYTSLAETKPEYFKASEPEGKYRVSEDEPAFIAREKADRNALIEEIKQAITLKALSNVTVSRLRSSFNVKAMKTSSMEDLKRLKAFIDTLEPGDRFISDKQLAALKDILKDVERPDITPRRIIIAKFGDKEEIMSGPVMGKIPNELIPTVDIKEGHPLIAKVVDEFEYDLDQGKVNHQRRLEKFKEMIEKAEESRGAKLTAMERLRRKLTPQNKELFDALGGLKTELTKEEAAVFAYAKNFFEKVKIDFELEKYRKDYVTHMGKPFMEKILTEGLLNAVWDVFNVEEGADIPINIMLEIDNIIGGEKFFKYAQERKGYGKPTTNLLKIIHDYSMLYETKKALDKNLPQGQAIVKLLLKPQTAKWMKKYLQNLKGRGLDNELRTGKARWLPKVADAIVSVGYYKLLGGNYKSAIKNIIAGESNSFIYTEFDKYLKGKWRLATHPGKVYEMAKIYGILDGTYVDYARQGIGVMQKLGDALLIGQKIGEIEIRSSLMAGELTDGEWSGVLNNKDVVRHLTPERLREIKNLIAITQGIFSKTETPLYLQTSIGRMYFQMNRWRITNGMLFRRIALGARQEVSKGNYFGKNMRRFSKMFILWGIAMYAFYELGKAGHKEYARIAKSMGELLQSIMPHEFANAVYKSLTANPTISILGEFVFSIIELAYYIGAPGQEKPKKIEIRKGIENTYAAPIKTVKELFGIKDKKKGKATYYKNPENRRMEPTLK